MEKEKLISLIEMLENEIESIYALPKVGHRAFGAFYLIEYIKSVLYDKETIDLEEVSLQLELLEKVKRKSERELIQDIQKTDDEKLEQIALGMAADTISQIETDDETINKEDFGRLKEYHLFLLKNGLIGKPIQMIEYNGYCAEQFPNLNILFTKDNGEMVFCNYYKKATKQELKKLIDDVKTRKTRTKV